MKREELIDMAKYIQFPYNNERYKDNIWEIAIAQNKTKHPAVFPEQIANDHIISWSNENDIVLILGKGNETYEKLSTGTIYFNDEEEAMAAIKEKLETKKLTLK